MTGGAVKDRDGHQDHQGKGGRNQVVDDPRAYREDYVTGLRVLTRQGIPIR